MEIILNNNMTTTERYIKELFGTQKYKIMTTTERSLLIAETMNFKIVDNPLTNKYINCVGVKINGGRWIEWHPDQSAEQREMIKEKLREWKLCYEYGYCFDEGFWFRIYDENRDLEINCNDIHFESEAFLQAVEQYCLTLKNQKP
jgi:hypothetical protein